MSNDISSITPIIQQAHKHHDCWMDHELILILALSLSLSLLRFMAALNQVDKDSNAADMADEDPDQSRQ